MRKLMSGALLSGMLFAMPLAGMAQDATTTTTSSGGGEQVQTTTTETKPAAMPAAPAKVDVQVNNPAPAPASSSVTKSSSSTVSDRSVSTPVTVQNGPDNNTTLLVAGGVLSVAFLAFVAFSMNRAN